MRTLRSIRIAALVPCSESIACRRGATWGPVGTKGHFTPAQGKDGDIHPTGGHFSSRSEWPGGAYAMSSPGGLSVVHCDVLGTTSVSCPSFFQWVIQDLFFFLSFSEEASSMRWGGEPPSSSQHLTKCCSRVLLASGEQGAQLGSYCKVILGDSDISATHSSAAY